MIPEGPRGAGGVVSEHPKSRYVEVSVGFILHLRDEQENLGDMADLRGMTMALFELFQRELKTNPPTTYSDSWRSLEMFTPKTKTAKRRAAATRRKVKP